MSVPAEQVQASNPAPKASVQDRLKSFLSGPEQAENPSADVAPVQSKATPVERQDSPAEKSVPKAEAEAEAEDQVEAADDAQSEDAQSEEWQPSSIDEFPDALGWENDKFYSLPVKVKIDGKESTVPLRDLVKSYQLDGHHHQKLAALDTDKKALMAERQQLQAERADKLLKLDAGLKTLERALIGDAQSVDWQKLAAEDPAAYNSKFVEFQQRQAVYADIANQISQEQQTAQAQQQQDFQKFLAEQKQMLLAKVPEWSDETRRAKDKADIVEYLGAQGISKEEFEGLTDHRYALVVRDAMRWSQLQKSKPAVLNKVKAAPKLLKPGTKQSKDVVTKLASNRERDTLRQSGKVRDAVPALKRLLFN